MQAGPYHHLFDAAQQHHAALTASVERILARYRTTHTTSGRDSSDLQGGIFDAEYPLNLIDIAPVHTLRTRERGGARACELVATQRTCLTVSLAM